MTADETYPGTRVPRDTATRWAALRYEPTDRGETVDSITAVWHEWASNDPRWAVLQRIVGVLRTDDCTGAMADLRREWIRMTDGLEVLLIEQGEADASHAATVLTAARAIDAAVIAALHELARAARDATPAEALR